MINIITRYFILQAHWFHNEQFIKACCMTKWIYSWFPVCFLWSSPESENLQSEKNLWMCPLNCIWLQLPLLKFVIICKFATSSHMGNCEFRKLTFCLIANIQYIGHQDSKQHNKRKIERTSWFRRVWFVTVNIHYIFNGTVSSKLIHVLSR